MAIRSVGQFEREVRRGIGHYKSAELKDVIDKLSLYHNKPLNPFRDDPLRYDLLVDLRDSLIRWANKHRPEFDARRGPQLAHEVMVELAASQAEREKLAREKLEVGDILFRWVPQGLDWAPENLGQRKRQAEYISRKQHEQHDSHMRLLEVYSQRRGMSLEELNELLGGVGINIAQSANFVQHVGIYAGDNIVIEVGGGGVYRNHVAKRAHYDLVVRCGQHGQYIADKARSARCTWYIYPLADVRKVAANCYLGTLLLNPMRADLERSDKKYAGFRGYALQQTVICSHFVNAVLYAALVPGGTLSTATDHAFDRIFKVSPAQMWREFICKQGLWAMADAACVGLQHKGSLNLDIDRQSLGVGL